MVNMDAPYEFDEHESMLSLEDCANIDVEVVPEITTTSSKSDVTGRWSAQEHDLFLEGLKTFGRNWKLIASLIPHRSVVQIRTHAQKHFQKLEKLNKPAIGKDGEPTGSPRANRSDSMTDSMFFGDQGKGIEFGLGGNGMSAPPKKVRAMTLSSAELSNGNSMDGHLRSSQASAFNYHDNSLFGDVIRSNSADLMNGSNSPTEMLNGHSKRNISDMMGSNGYAMSMGGYGENGSLGLTISPFYSGIGAKPSGSPRAYNRKGNGVASGKSRVNRSKSFEELSRSEHKRSPAVDSDGQEDNSNLGIPITSRKHTAKTSPRAPRKSAVGMKRSQSTNGMTNQSLMMDGFPSEVSPTSVLGVSVIDNNWGGHFGMHSKATSRHGVSYNTSSNIGGGVDYSLTPCSMLPVLFPDFDDVVRSMEIEESGQLQYIEYKQHVPMHKPAPPLLSDDLCLSIIHEDMEFDDLTASCRELWGSGYNFIDNADQLQDCTVNAPSSGMDGQFTDNALLMDRKSVSIMDSASDSHHAAVAASNGVSDTYNYQQVFVPLPNTLDDGCLTDGLEQLFY